MVNSLLYPGTRNEVVAITDQLFLVSVVKSLDSRDEEQKVPLLWYTEEVNTMSRFIEGSITRTAASEIVTVKVFGRIGISSIRSLFSDSESIVLAIGRLRARLTSEADSTCSASFMWI